MSIKGIRKNILLGIIMGSISFTLLACNKKEIKSVMDKNEVIVGLDDAFAPMGFKDESGEIVGFDVDLAKEVGDRLGKKVVFQPIDWSMKESELNNGNIDFIWNGYTITEERSIREVLNLNSWNYAASYKASRIYMEDVKKEYPSLKYFIDLHRDSLKKDKTTIQIGDKSYAKIIFLIGLENVNYQKNLAFTEEINNKIGEKYPGLSKGIYKKGGAGVNGVYNQDFSPYTILIEIGGCENTTSEV